MNAVDPIHNEPLAARIGALIAAATECSALGWTPATSSNFSLRIDDASALITRSGRDKGRLNDADLLRIDFDGCALPGETAKPSAEAPLHGQIYRRLPHVGSVLHTHSRTQTVASRWFAAAGVVRLEGWELQKAITGISSHETAIDVPVFANSQSMPDLMHAVDAWLDAGRPLHAYLIAGHGIYTWGRDIDQAKRHLEALEFMLACELDLKRLSS